MLIKTLLNRCFKFKSFVYGIVRFSEGKRGPELLVEIQPRRNAKPVCHCCAFRGGCYDHLPERRYELVPLWGIRVFLLYRPRRVNCPSCGIVVERVPWAEGKNQETIAYKLFLSHWARKVSDHSFT